MAKIVIIPLLLLVTLYFCATACRSNSSFTFCVYPYSTVSQPTQLPQDFNKLDGFSHPLTTHDLWNMGNILASYGGYVTVSDLSGQISFPHMTQEPTFMLIATTAIKPIFMLGNTVHHWELLPYLQASCYSIERKQDSATQLYFWQVQAVAKPKNIIIPFNGLVIFIDPANLIVPCGISLTSGQSAMILPDLYVINAADQNSINLKIPTIKAFFGSLKPILKKQGEAAYARIIEPQ